MNTKGRLIAAVIALTFIAYAVYVKQYNIIVYIAGFIAYLLWSHMRDGTVYLATQSFHKKDYEKTKTLLAEIKNPDRLRKGRRNFYEFMLGNIALHEGDIDKAEYHFQMASRLPWRKDYEKAMVLINLANINLRKKEYERVNGYIEVTEKLKLTARQISILDKIKNEVKKYI